MKLFCLPYAGATSRVFRRLSAHSDIVKQCEIVPIDIPGRGTRMAEPFCSSIEEAAEDLAKQMVDMIEKKEEYAVYAHSLGCILAYELMYKMKERGYALPVHIFFSGKNAPDIPSVEKGHMDGIDDETIITGILQVNSEYTEVYKNKAMANVFVRIYRADLKMLEDYEYQEKKYKLPVDINFFYSVDDSIVNIEHVKHWQDFITGNLQLYYFKGGHFFMFNNIEPMVEIMLKTVLEIEDGVPY